MNLKQIFTELSNHEYQHQEILSVFKIAFDEYDEIALFKTRAKLIAYLNLMIDELSKNPDNDIDNFEKETINEICQGISYKTLSSNMGTISPYFSKAHISALLTMEKLYKSSQKISNINELNTLNEELKSLLVEDEKLISEQFDVLKQLNESIDDAIINYEVIGDKAVNKLYIMLCGIAALHHTTIGSIKSTKIKSSLKKIYENVYTLNKLIDLSISTGSKTNSILDWINKI